MSAADGKLFVDESPLGVDGKLFAEVDVDARPFSREKLPLFLLLSASGGKVLSKEEGEKGELSS